MRRTNSRPSPFSRTLIWSALRANAGKTTNSRVAETAFQLASPAWLATIATRPVPANETPAPSAASVAGPKPTANATGNPLEAAAARFTFWNTAGSGMAAKSRV